MRLSLTLLAAALLCACATTPPPLAATAPALPAQWSTSGDAGGSAGIAPDWWHSLGSAELDALVQAAQAQSLDAAAAAARLRQAEAAARQAGAALLPALTASVDASRQARFSGGSSTDGTAANRYAAGFAASYEIDFWGRQRAGQDAALARLQASAFDQGTVGLTLTAAVADAWLRLVGGRERLAIAGLNLQGAERVLALVDARARAGAATPLELAQQRGLVATQRQAIEALRQQVQGHHTALAVLLGQATPPPVQADTLAGLQPPAIGAGLPAELLVRRPDVARAEAQLAAAHADLQGARAALLPRITLGAGLGVGADRLGRAFEHPLYSLAAGLTAPIFDGGRLAAGADIAQARRDELLAQYQAAIVAAVGDAEVALQAVAGTDAQTAAQAQVLEQAQQAHALAQVRYRAGADTLLTLLDAQRTLYAAQDNAAQLRQARLIACVALYKALGGGWQPAGVAVGLGRP
ncbi:efflux transporter outer membrane subunit [Acidovorax sp.]|uniref:efflux transporter outer membrane subunit n=1 Tax=Acidovorax sp. TaxID=1872122 RepID=UPI002ACE6A86|nr:efflux transporter outer membrane subunit [Acidovorax sp.]MDZ7864973.1 efflux transporter outer membrane subunit [Acidovorax sp.]